MNERPGLKPIAGDPGLLNGIAWSVRWLDRDRSVNYAAAVLDALGETRDKTRSSQRGRACLTIAWQHRWHGAFSQSLSAALDVEKHLSETEFPIERGQNYAILAFLHFCNGRMDLATHAVDRGLSVVQAHTPFERSSSAYVDLLMSRANILRFRGDTGRAGLVLGNAEEVAREADAALVQHYTARWLVEDGCPEKAAERAERALTDAKKLRANLLLPLVHEVLGEAQAGLGDFAAAEENFETGLAGAKAGKNVRAEVQILRAYSQMERARGNSEQALKLNRRAKSIADSMSYLLHQLYLARECAAILEARGESGAALEEHNRAWTLADKCRN